MGISKKGRRKLIFNGRLFVWYVRDDPDSADTVLHVASEDNRFIVKYWIAQPEPARFLAVLGREFPGLPEAGGSWIRVLCPEFETDSLITPASVRDLIEWCLVKDRQLIRVDWEGKIIADHNNCAKAETSRKL